MKERHLSLLRSPETGGPLELREVFEARGDDVISGRLFESSTGGWFRIERGIADLTPLALRSPERHAAFCASHGLGAGPIAAAEAGRHEQEQGQIAFFDRYHDSYETEVVDSPYYRVLDNVTFADWARRSLPKESRVLEIGCGSGRQTLPLTALGHDVIALDLSEEMLRLAGRKLAEVGRSERVGLVAASAEALPVAAGAFDACVIYGSLHHFRDPQTVLRKAAAALRPEGRFYLLEPHNSPVRFVFDWLMKKRPLWQEEAADEPLFEAMQLKEWLRPGGIECEISYSTYLPPHLFYGLSQSSGEKLLTFSDRVLSSLPGLRRLAGVIIAEGVKRLPARQGADLPA